VLKNIPYLLRYIFKVRLKRKIKSKAIVFLQKNVSLVIETEGIIDFGKNILLKEGTIIYAKKNARITIGDNTSTGHHTEISANNDIRIGSDVIMGAQTYITDSNHGYKNFDIPIRENPMEVGKTTIGSNVWLGRNVMLLKDSHIGDNSIVAVGSVVTNSFPDNMILGGVPANEMKSIYD